MANGRGANDGVEINSLRLDNERLFVAARGI